MSDAGSAQRASSGASRCARCGASFNCGLQAGEPECWCAALPPLEPVPGRGCLCRPCLLAELARAGRYST